MTMSYRILGGLDGDEMAELHSTSFDRPWDSESFAALLKRPTCLGVGAVLAPTPTLTGFALFQHVEHDAEVLTLVVSPKERRRGIARALLQTGEHHLAARACSRLFLDVAEDNFAALALYKELGFQIEGRRTNYYAQPNRESVDALVMSRAITGLP
ncbi:MAG: ribosomal protein S18-alanine N-acetyltransferase [Pseudomonadota bacterium]